MKSRVSQTKLNIAVSLLYQVIAAVIGLILPRFILTAYGSQTNGIIHAISQMLSYTVLLECGIGGMVTASFYKPLAVGDNEAVSDIFNNTKKFFTKISLIYTLFVVVLTFISPFIIKSDFNFVYTASMVLILGVSNYFTYYFSMAQTLLIKADQKLRIYQSFLLIAITLNAVVSILLIKAGFGIHAVKTTTAFIFLITPLSTRFYVKKHYTISKKVFDKNRKLPEKKDGVIHHLSYFIHKNTDIVILTFFCGVKVVSVYSVYNVVAVALESLLGAVSNGIAAKFGNIIALKEKNSLNKSFEFYNGVNMIVSAFFCTVTAILIIPFVKIYTSGVTDINYIRPFFAVLVVITQWIYFIRIPFATTITSAGHYKETKTGAIGKVIINLGLSLILVKPFGLNGVIAGTLFSVIFETFYMVNYLSKNLVSRKRRFFFLESAVNFITSLLLIILIDKFMVINPKNILLLVVDAVKVSVIVLSVLSAVNLATNKKLRMLFKKETENANS